jgi:branched-chain amino acid transport system substrate-binding protein
VTLARTFLAAATFSGLALGASADAGKRYGPGVTDTEIKIGQTMPYSGPLSTYGTIGRAEAAYFRMINEQGGVGGRKIVLVSLDDGYSPPRTLEQIRRLVEQERVLLVFNSFGTAPNAAIQPYLNERGVPQLFPVSGATRWGDPAHYPWTIGFQPSLRVEGHAVARYIRDNRPNAKIAVLYQNDDFGKDYLKGLTEGLQEGVGRNIVRATSYETTDPTVDSQIVTLQASGADILVNVSAGKFAAMAIRKAYQIGWKPLQFVFSGASTREAMLGLPSLEQAAGLITAQWFKDPTDPKWRNDAAVGDWMTWMGKYYPEGDRTSAPNVAGYIEAAALVQVLRQCNDDLSRENVMRQAANLDFELPILLPGIKASTSPTQFFAIHEVTLKRFDGAVWESIDRRSPTR